MSKLNQKYIVITGGVISGIGKGILTSSIGFLLKDDFKLNIVKLDPYLNIDPGTMNPFEHGEVFVLEDGAECDMDFGHYMRFCEISNSKEDSITMGKVYNEIFEKERAGDFLGKNVQIFPDVVNYIVDKLINNSKKKKSQINLIELGGTIGDIEAEVFVKSLNQLKQRVGEENILYIHLTYLVENNATKEQKTKPTQQSLDMIRQRGIYPDILILRSKNRVQENLLDKVSNMTLIPKENIFSLLDLDDIHKVPLFLNKQKILKTIKKKFKIGKKTSTKSLDKLDNLLNSKKSKKLKILIFGKYAKFEDSYFSVIQSIKHSCYKLKCEFEITFLDENFDTKSFDVKSFDACVIPGGFGDRGIEKTISIIKLLRENNIATLGICLGLQLMVIEFLRNVCGLKNVNSFEFDKKAKNLAIILMNEQNKITKLGGTMRLGNYTAKLKNSQIKDLYKKDVVIEKHRHRYEVNPKYEKILEKKGLKIVGKSVKRNLVEFIELDEKLHKYFVGCQAHPELNSTLLKPNPLFLGLIKKALKK